MPERRRMDVEVDHGRRPARMPDGQAGFLLGLTNGSLPWCLSVVDVATGLQPPMQAPMAMQNGAPGANHHG